MKIGVYVPQVGPAATGDTGFAPGMTVTRTVFELTPAEVGGRTLLETEYEVAIPAEGDEATSPVVVSRTYRTQTDPSGRETERQTVMVDRASNLDTLTVVREVTTVFP